MSSAGTRTERTNVFRSQDDTAATTPPRLPPITVARRIAMNERTKYG
jgi:hypothetical protein